METDGEASPSPPPRTLTTRKRTTVSTPPMRWVVLGAGDDVAAAIKSLLHPVHQHLLVVAWCAIDETVFRTRRARVTDNLTATCCNVSSRLPWYQHRLLHIQVTCLPPEPILELYWNTGRLAGHNSIQSTFFIVFYFCSEKLDTPWAHHGTSNTHSSTHRSTVHRNTERVASTSASVALNGPTVDGRPCSEYQRNLARLTNRHAPATWSVAPVTSASSSSLSSPPGAMNLCEREKYIHALRIGSV
uniref:Uncharacterized protein n=1 Tax=Anopheles albimanus TaxID=7167 RepID=A0A182FHY1_ANOAL